MLTQKASRAQDLIDQHVVRLKRKRPSNSDYKNFKRELDLITLGDSIMYEACIRQYCERSKYLAS